MSNNKFKEKYNYTQFLDKTMGKEGLLSDLENGLKYSNERVAEVDTQLKDDSTLGRNARELADIFWYWHAKRAKAVKKDVEIGANMQETAEDDEDIIETFKTKEDWFGKCKNWKSAEWHQYVKNNFYKIPDQRMLMYVAVFDNFNKMKTSTDYMERLVARYGDKEFKDDDTLRLKILKQFIKHSEWETADLYADAEDLYNLENLAGDVLKDALLKRMDDQIFSLTEIKLTASELSKVILKTITDEWLQVEVKEPEELVEMFENYDPVWATKEKLQYFEQLQVEEDSVEDKMLLPYVESIEKAVRKQFKDASKEEKNQPKRLTQQKKDDKNSKCKKDHVLLKTAHSLAKGLFLKNSPTKEMLYRFAIVFGMDVSEVEKSLFHDYYGDSLMKYFAEDYPKNKANIEEPQGDGIDYKNYMEVCFLYALWQENMTRNEKMQLADRLIQTIKKIPKFKRAKKEMPKEETIYFKEEVKNIVGEMNEDEFVDFIRSEFYIPSGKKAVMKNNAVQKHAQMVFDGVVQSLLKVHDGDMNALRNLDFGELRLYPKIDNLVEIADVLKDETQAKVTEKERKKRENDFKKLIVNLIEKMLRIDARSTMYRDLEKGLKEAVAKKEITKKEMEVQLKRFDGGEKRVYGDKFIKRGYVTLWDEKGPVTRTKLLAAMFYHYLLEGTFLPEEFVHTVQLRDGNHAKERVVITYSEMLEKISEQVNPVLEECRYQEISTKNLFDIMLVLLLTNSDNVF